MAFGSPKQIQVKYDAALVENMLSLLRSAPFPDKEPIDTGSPWNLGIDYEYLKQLKASFLNKWTWASLERKISMYENYIVHYENEGDTLDLHYVHAKSPRGDAIPLILLHGWPGTFFDFHKVIEPLTNPSDATHPVFHVVIPSLPGYFLSTLPRRDGWNLVDTAKVFNGLMTSVLGYQKYTGQGGDWGSYLLRYMASLFPESVSLMHFNFFRTPRVANSNPSADSEFEKQAASRSDEFLSTGAAYFAIQNTKPFTIGFAIASSPLAVLAYIECIEMQDILDTVALYYLSGSFPTSVVIYNQGKERAELVAGGNEKWRLKNKFGYSRFPFEIGGASKYDIAANGPLVFYKEHSHGGHFPALDNPVEFVADLQEFFGANWAE